MGSPKALLPLGEATFLERAIHAFGNSCDPVLIVVSPGREDLHGTAGRARVITNPEPERGQLSSLQCGLAEVPADSEAVAFCPVDYPNVKPATVAALIAALDGNAAIAVPRFKDQHGHPVLVRRAIMDELLALSPLSTAREVIHRHASQTAYVDVDDPGILLDVDTPEDYRAAGGSLEAL
jgi:molybdenum cofactor cytidylyltransferase